MGKKKEPTIVEYVSSKLIRVPFPPVPEDEDGEVEDIAEIEEEEEEEQEEIDEREQGWNESYETMLAKGEDLGCHYIDGGWTSWASYWVLEKRAEEEFVLWWMGGLDEDMNTPRADKYGTYATREKAIAAMQNHLSGDGGFD